MSGGNCPETPRQKMIAMMYLVYLGMLALNVSGELLNAFVSMDEGFKQSRQTVERKNTDVYTQFDAAKSNNPRKVQAFWDEAQQIKTKSNRLVAYLDSLKYLIVRTVDGPQATPEKYISIDNQDIVPQLMITEKNRARSKALKDSITAYKKLLISKLDPKSKPDSSYITSFNNMFDVSDIPGEKEGMKPWEDVKFEHVPLAASMALLSKMQGDVRSAEGDMISLLYTKIDKGSFKYTHRLPVWIAPKSTVLEGEPYKLELMMAAYDPTAQPKMTINGAKVTDIKEGKGYFEMRKGVGNYTWKGEILAPNADGSGFDPFPITGEFQVVKPSAVVSPVKMNVFYEGVVNPVAVSVPGVADKDITVSMTNVSSSKNGGIYSVKPRPGSAGKRSIVTVYAKVGDKKKVMGTSKFRIKRIPDPVPEVAGKSGGKIPKNTLLAQSAVFAEMKDFDFDLKYNITQFTVSAVKKGFIVDEKSDSNKFTAGQKKLIKSLSRGARVSIEGIRAKGPDGSIRKLGTMTFRLQ